SDAERVQLNDLGIDPAAIHLIPNPVDLDEFTSPVPRGAFRRSVALPTTSRVVVFLGKLTRRKRVDVLVRAFARLDRSDTWLARAIDGVLAAPVEWRAAAADAGRRVRAAYGGDVVCAQLEHLYGDMIASA